VPGRRAACERRAQRRDAGAPKGLPARHEAFQQERDITLQRLPFGQHAQHSRPGASWPTHASARACGSGRARASCARESAGGATAAPPAASASRSSTRASAGAGSWGGPNPEPETPGSGSRPPPPAPGLAWALSAGALRPCSRGPTDSRCAPLSRPARRWRMPRPPAGWPGCGS